MSRTGHKIKRVENDSYQTPKSTLEPLLPYLELSDIKFFLEPCKGEGNIIDLIKPLLPETCVTEYAELTEGRDYFTHEFKQVDLIITNPPFSKALEFLEKSLKEAKTVIYLLRLNFLASQKRREFWSTYPPDHIFVLSTRPCFVWKCKTKGCKKKYPVGTKVCSCGGKVGPGTDATEYAWFVWDTAGIVNINQWLTVL
jgi:hypothetical protein